MSKRVYLAGPDVFFKDATVRADAMKRLCADYGLDGVFPLDAALAFTDEMMGPERAMIIFKANVALIKRCHGVLANMMPFRGPSTDVGTAWEMGFAFSMGLPVVGYSPDGRYYEERVKPDQYDIESFKGIDNLMLSCGCAAYFAGSGSAPSPESAAAPDCPPEELAVIELARILGVK